MSHMSAIFNFDLNFYILIQTPSQLDIWLQRYEQFCEV